MKVLGPVLILTEPKKRTIADGKGVEYSAVCRWRLPRGERMLDQNGESAMQYHCASNLRFTFWKNRDGNFPFVTQELRKGNTIFVEGHLITGRRKDGSFFTDVRVTTIHPLPRGSSQKTSDFPPKTENGNRARTAATTTSALSVDDIPF